MNLAIKVVNRKRKFLFLYGERNRKMKTVTRQGKRIIIHTGQRAYICLHQKARSKGYKTCWTGDSMICMKKAN